MSTQQRPLLLVSNDDGIESFFLKTLVDALCERYEVVVVAPAAEQSWVGRGVTRRGTLTARPVEGWPCEAWSVSGTPSDCVQVGLHHILGATRRPHAVISGMNLGMNITLNLTLGSGTVAAATEGAFAGLPSIAFSLGIEGERFAEVSAARGWRDEEGNAITRAAAARCLELTQVILAREEREAVAREGAPRSCVVHNINLPAHVSVTSEVRETTLASAPMPSLFERLPESEGVESEGVESEGAFQLRFCFAKEWRYTHNPESSDLRALRAGAISHCVLDWGRLSVPST